MTNKIVHLALAIFLLSIYPCLADTAVGNGSGGGGSSFATGITVGVPGVDGPFAVLYSENGPVTFTSDASAEVDGDNSDVVGDALSISAAPSPTGSPVPIMVLDHQGDLGVSWLSTVHGIYSHARGYFDHVEPDDGTNQQGSVAINPGDYPGVQIDWKPTPDPSPAPSPTPRVNITTMIGPHAGVLCGGVDSTVLHIGPQANIDFTLVRLGGISINTAGDVGMCNTVTTDGGIITAKATNSVVAYPWHPASAPSCAVGVGGTSCSTTVTLPHSGMDCTANIDGTALLGGLIGEVLVSISGTTETLTYATPTWAAGGTATFHNICN